MGKGIYNITYWRAGNTMIIKRGETAMDFEIIPAKELDEYINSPNTLIIDLRSKEDFDCFHVPSSVNIPYEELENQQYRLYDYYQLVLYCERGNISLLAARRLSRLGYRVKNVYGGILAYINNSRNFRGWNVKSS